MPLLQIHASLLDEQSVSRQRTATIVKRSADARPGTDVIHRDRAGAPVGHAASDAAVADAAALAA